jgi:alkanesulfonate monooxygenase SsuD/methylene tetrahydromethanopterin reductase-like flavin-dependent oxidoreductase (luciferase family)/FAD/FMN-containing dehydrogenase
LTRSGSAPTLMRMVDYGHPLRFGSFITPAASTPQRTVDLAVASEAAGLDLVTFQDHPYQPAFLDTWTLLSWVAARTERIHLSGNVLNVPLRIPSVLASAAASLDLLSGGRVELGLGAGGFWDAIAAMGVPALTAGESVTALEEAIDVIRGRWDTADRSVLRAGGALHHVDGAKRGPAPAHAIPIWVGARGPRMQRLIGRKGDGWLPSLPWLQPGDLARGNATIDAAAESVGRDPREVVRLLNISPNETVEDLVRLALEDGVSTFILASDDASTIRRFGEEVAPAVRDGVGAVRAQRGTTTVARVRGAIARAKRRPGIDYEGVPASLAGTAVEPGDHGYARYTSSYLRGGAPGLVLRPRTVPEVQEAVRFADAHRDLPLGVFSAGHGLSGRSLNRDGLVIDVGALNTIEVLDAERGLVRIGPGALWVEVAEALAPHGLAITSGDYGGVGVGGLATAGGVGWFAREHGLTIDHLRAVEVVLADGSTARASATEHPDLFWAMRGAGANFGVATAFEFEARRVGQVAFAQLAYEVPDTAAMLEAWGTAMETADRSVTGEIIMGRGGSAQAMVVVDSDDPDTILERLQPFAAVATLVDSSIALTSYDQVMRAMVSDAPQQGRGEPRSHSGLVAHLSPEVSRVTAALLDSGASYFCSVRAVGGAVADVPSDATAYAGRSANFNIAAFGAPGSDFDGRWADLLPLLDGMYLSFESDTGPEVVARAFPPAHLARLRALKAQYDPHSLFRDNFYITPEAVEEVAVA